jgi:hypothetical protein
MNAGDATTHTVAEVAARFQVTTEWLQRRVWEASVPHLRINRRTVLFTDAHIREMERSFEVKPIKKPPVRRRRRRAAA